MRTLIRVAAIAVALLMAAFVIYVFWDTDGKGNPELSETPAANPNAFVFTSHEECRECHPTYFEEWEKSWHRQAWSNPWVQASFGCYRDQDCKSCHVPEPLMANGRSPRLIPRPEGDYDSGINCLTCHISPMGVLGPEGRNIEMAKHCTPVKHETIATDSMCWECHPNQYDDWMTSSFRGKKGCKDCHMEQVERSVVPNGPVRKTRVHFWKGARTLTFLKTSYKFTTETKPEGLVVTVKNGEVGHFLPGERHNRALWVEVTFYDPDGKQIGEMDKWVIREGSNLPRNMKLLDIKPDGQVSKLYKYPDGKGFVKAVLKYDYFYSNEDEHTRVLEDPPALAFPPK